MAANQILPFAQDGAALVQSQAAFAADAQRLIGHQPGVARPDFANKQARQASVIAAGIAQFIADNQSTDVTDLLTPAALAAMLIAAIKAQTLMPAGTIVWIPGTVAPTGTIKVNGSLISRTTYARIWTYAQASGNLSASEAAWLSEFGKFSPGDGATNFRIPDLRGYHFRAWDDGRGINAGRGIGTVEGDLIASHTHTANDPGHGHSINDPGHLHNVNASRVAPPGGAEGGARDAAGQTDFNSGTAVTGITINGATTGITIAAAGGAENRVKNIALMPIMFI